MSIKNIENSLNTVNNFSSDLEQIDTNKDNTTSNLEKINDLSTKLNNNIRLKNIRNMLFYDEKKNRLILKIYSLIKHLNLMLKK